VFRAATTSQSNVIQQTKAASTAEGRGKQRLFFFMEMLTMEGAQGWEEQCGHGEEDDGAN